jgi:hypothetical protein
MNQHNARHYHNIDTHDTRDIYISPSNRMRRLSFSQYADAEPRISSQPSSGVAKQAPCPLSSTKSTRCNILIARHNQDLVSHMPHTFRANKCQYFYTLPDFPRNNPSFFLFFYPPIQTTATAKPRFGEGAIHSPPLHTYHPTTRRKLNNREPSGPPGSVNHPCHRHTCRHKHTYALLTVQYFISYLISTVQLSTVHSNYPKLKTSRVRGHTDKVSAYVSQTILMQLPDLV